MNITGNTSPPAGERIYLRYPYWKAFAFLSALGPLSYIAFQVAFLYRSLGIAGAVAASLREWDDIVVPTLFLACVALWIYSDVVIFEDGRFIVKGLLRRSLIVPHGEIFIRKPYMRELIWTDRLDTLILVTELGQRIRVAKSMGTYNRLKLQLKSLHASGIISLKDDKHLL